MCVDKQTVSESVSLLGSLVSFSAGFLTAMFAEPARQWFFKPVLRLSFSNADDCVAGTGTVGPHSIVGPSAIYVRVKVVNEKRKLARQCRAYLVKVERLNVNGKFEPTVYTDSIQLAWSCQQQGKEREPIDLPHGVSQYVDVVATQEGHGDGSGGYQPQIAPFPIRYSELFNLTPKTLRFTIQISGDGVDPKFIRVVFVWKGKWDSFDVYHDEE